MNSTVKKIRHTVEQQLARQGQTIDYSKLQNPNKNHFHNRTNSMRVSPSNQIQNQKEDLLEKEEDADYTTAFRKKKFSLPHYGNKVASRAVTTLHTPQNRQLSTAEPTSRGHK